MNAVASLPLLLEKRVDRIALPTLVQAESVLINILSRNSDVAGMINGQPGPPQLLVH